MRAPTDVARHMAAVKEVVSNSNISSHVKGDILSMLTEMEEQEILRLVRQEALASPKDRGGVYGGGHGDGE